MGGWMSYRRFRDRNGLNWRPEPDNPNPYPPHTRGERHHLILGDLNRMERGYLAPEVDDGRSVGGVLEDSPLHDAAAATGIDIETVRRLLTYVFTEQR